MNPPGAPANPPPSAGATRPWPALYPMWLAIAYMAMLFITSGASPFAVLRLLLVTTAVGLALCLVAPRLIGDRDRGAMLALAAVFMLLVGQSPLQVVLVGALVAILFLDARFGTRRRASPWPAITRWATRVTAIILLAVAIRAVQEGTIASVAHDLAAEGPFRPTVASVTASSMAGEGEPDIYLVLLDGYARADKLQSLFGYDNAPFVRALEDRGFRVADHSRSNYLVTELSLSSLFNMTLLDRESGDASLSRLVRIRRLVNDAVAWPFLRAKGYESIAVASGFETVALRSVDRVVDTGEMNELEVVGLRTTALGALATALAPDAVAEQHRSRVRDVLRATAALAAEPHARPQFVFAHVPSPHAPAVFDAAGGKVASSDLVTFYEESAAGRGLTPQEYGRRYTDQLAYLNRLTLDSLDRLLASTSRPTVVVLFSDHGSAAGLNWADLEHSDLDERTANLFATLTPGREALFDDSPTLVNVLPTLFDSYLGGTFPNQPDTVFRWKDDEFNLFPIDLPDE